jgi:hypothetical protein
VGVRNAEDGPARDGNPGQRTPPVEVAKRDETPRKVLRRTRAAGRARTGRTLKGSESSREDEPAWQRAGDGDRRRTAVLTGNGKAHGREVTQQPRWSVAYNTLES